MAKEVITRLIDDITGDPVEDSEGESIRFAVGGVDYEIDLNKKNAAKFHETLKFYTDHATKVESPGPAYAPPTRRRASSGAKPKADKEQLAAMRSWLKQQGHKIADRGRIAQNLQELYHEAHK